MNPRRVNLKMKILTKTHLQRSELLTNITRVNHHQLTSNLGKRQTMILKKHENSHFLTSEFHSGCNKKLLNTYLIEVGERAIIY